MKLLQRDVVWVSFPFTDARSFKERPALVLSHREYNQASLDVLLCYITTKKQGQYVIPISQKQLEEGQLQKPSFIRYDKVLLVDKTRIIGVIATVKEEVYNKVTAAICDFIRLPKDK